MPLSVGQLVGIAQRNVLPDGRAARVHRLHQRQEGHVEAQHLVFGVVGDPGDLVRMQARIDGVQHAPGAADAEVHFQVAIAVPGQGGDAVGEQQLHRRPARWPPGAPASATSRQV